MTRKVAEVSDQVNMYGEWLKAEIKVSEAYHNHKETVVKLKMKNAELIVKYDFGTFPETWTVSTKSSTAHVGPTLGLFNRKTDVRLRTVSGFEPGWVYPPYCESQTRFSCELQDEWDLAAFIRLVLNEDS